ncbi:MAG: hypothetical protein ACRDTH_28725 [Pseudonocardiaceae bacterium]
MPDRYSPKTIKLLFGTASYCAYPGCLAPLVFKDRGLLTVTAQISHIRSEKKNGPRYDKEYREDPNGFENLLLLCGTHHPPVDRHESEYLVDELLSWKAEQVKQADNPLGGADISAIQRIVNEEKPIASDAVLRGPIAHLDEAERLQQAEDRASEAPAEAAILFDQVATHLEASPFAGHASIVRRQQATALEAAHEYEAAARLRIDLGWHSYRAGDPFLALQQVKSVADQQAHLSQATVRAVNGLSTAAAFGYEHHATLDDVADAFDAMQPDDRARMECGLVLAEQAVAWHRTELLTEHENALKALAHSTSIDDHGLAVRARLLMCVAEASGDWDELVSTARTTYPAVVTAWVLARHARYLSLVGLPEQALERWLDATERATQTSTYGSAADWLYGQRTTRVQYWMLNGDPNDLHRRAQALRTAGGGAVLPEPYPLAERALSRMLDKKWPDAMECLNRYLSHAVTTASWAAEMSAHERLGDLFMVTEKWPEAVTHYVQSGRDKKLKQLAKLLPDEPFQFRPPSADAPHWERTSSFRFAAAIAELLPDDLASAWAGAAFHEVTSALRRAPVIDIWMPAFEAFASVADAATLEVAEAFLDFTAPYLNREYGEQWRTDDSHVKAMTKIADAHPTLRDRVREMLCKTILLDGEVGQAAALEGEEILSGNSALVSERLAVAAEDGNLSAALGLVIAGADTGPAEGVARQRLECYIEPVNHQPGVSSIGAGFGETAMLVTALDDADRQRFVEAMLVRVQDTCDGAWNRRDALGAVAVVGRCMSNDAKTKVFDTLLFFAENPTQSNSLFTFGNDSFSRFKVNFGNPSLAADALRAASELAHTPQQFEAIQRVAVELLPTGDDHACLVLARALRSVPAQYLAVDVVMFASHPNRWLRAFAAVAWARNPDRWSDLGIKLSSDPDPRVRYALASALNEIPAHASVRHTLSVDHRREIRRRVAEW